MSNTGLYIISGFVFVLGSIVSILGLANLQSKRTIEPIAYVNLSDLTKQINQQNLQIKRLKDRTDFLEQIVIYKTKKVK